LSRIRKKNTVKKNTIKNIFKTETIQKTPKRLAKVILSGSDGQNTFQNYFENTK